MSQITPFVKRMRTQGGTLYTFSSAVEDIGLNINERNNIVKMSNFALLDIPKITSPTNLQQNRFNVFAIDGAIKNYEDSGSIKDGRVVVAESFQNYALNLETNLLSEDGYNPALLRTVSERVFWKWMKETGAVRWVKDVSNAGYFIEEIDTDSSVGYNSVVKYVGEISAGSVRTDTFGTYNETYVLVPTSHGQTRVYFKQVYDDNYAPEMNMGPGGINIKGRENYLQPHPDGLSLIADYDVIDSSITAGSWGMQVDVNDGAGYSDGWWYTAQGQPWPGDEFYYFTDASTVLDDPSTYNYNLKLTNGGDTVEFQRSNVDAVGIEYNLNSLKNIFGDDTLTFDKMAIEDSVDDHFEFNAVLIYYTVYNKTLDKILATNLLGILFLDAASGNTSGFPDMEITIPTISKLQSTSSGFGSSYSFRINIKSDNMIDDTQATIFDESTSSQTALYNWTSVFANLEKTLSILNQHTGTINYITDQYMGISGIQTQQGNTISDLQHQVNDITQDITGTKGAIPMFTGDVDDAIADSSIYMDLQNDRIGVYTDTPEYPFHVDVSMKTMDITIENAVRDTSGNVILGYGSPLQLGSSTNYRDIAMYVGDNDPIIFIDTSSNIRIRAVDVSIDGSLNIGGNTVISGELFVTGDSHLSGGITISGYIPDSSAGVPGSGLEWNNGFLTIDPCYGGVNALYQLDDVSVGGFGGATIPYGWVLTWDGSLWTYMDSGEGDVEWGNDNVGSINELMTSGGDGSILSQSGLTYANSVLTVDGSLIVSNLAVDNMSITNNLSVGNAITSASLTSQDIDASTILTQVLKAIDVSIDNELSYLPNTGTPSGLILPYLFVDELDGMKIKRHGGVGPGDGSVRYVPNSEVMNRVLTAGGGSTVFGNPALSLTGAGLINDILEFDSSWGSKTIRMADGSAYYSTPRYLNIFGQLGVGDTSSLTTGTYPFPPYTYTWYSLNGKDGGRVYLRGGKGADIVGSGAYTFTSLNAGDGGDLLLYGGAAGTGGGGGVGDVYLNGGNVIVSSGTVDLTTIRPIGTSGSHAEIKFIGTSAIEIDGFSSGVNLTVTPSNGIVINDESRSYIDFRVESDSNPHMLFVDAGNNRVGINQASPITELDVSGGANITEDVSIGGDLDVEGEIKVADNINTLKGTIGSSGNTIIINNALPGDMYMINAAQTNYAAPVPPEFVSAIVMVVSNTFGSPFVGAQVTTLGSNSMTIAGANSSNTDVDIELQGHIATTEWTALKLN